jgi:hypothetical protein
VLCVSGKFGDLLTYATFASLLFYILTIFGVFILRRENLMLKGLIVWLSVCAGTVHNSDYCNLYYIIGIRHFKYRFGTGNCSLGNTVYYFLMDNKRIVKVLHWATSFNSPCFLTVIFVVSNSIISNLLNSDSKQIDL